MDTKFFSVGIAALLVLAWFILMNMHTSDITLFGATILFLVTALGLLYYWLVYIHSENV